MRTVRVGDREVTAIGCGDLSLSIAAARGVDRRDVERALTAALELGLTFIDVHPAEDDAERLAGDVIRTQRARDRVITATTIPMLGGRDTPIDRMPPAYIQARVETALRTTKLDALPLAQLALRPAWLTSRAWPELEGTAERLVREGKVLAWGVRLEERERVPDAETDGPDATEIAAVTPGATVFFDPERAATYARDRARDRDPGATSGTVSDELRALIAVPWFASLSLTYSLCMRAAEPLLELALAPLPLGPEPPPVTAAPTPILSLFDITATPTPVVKPRVRRTEPIAVLARHPLAGGALAGTIGPGAKLTPRDDRNALDDATLYRVALEVARLAPLVRMLPPAARSTESARALLDRTERPEHVTSATLAELALRYVIDHGALALPRLHRHELVPEALMAAMAEPLPTPVVAWMLDDKS